MKENNKNNNNKVCFVLEGGALRGLYTAGVLDVLYDNNINIDSIIGVSAGALFGVNYFSNQPGRVIRYNRKYCNDIRYISLISLLLTGNVVNKKFSYYKLSKKLDPFDEDAFIKSNKTYYAVATDIETGKPNYLQIKSPIKDLELLRASSAMPVLSRLVKINDKKYLDGAISDSIPIRKALEMGYKKIVVILTQPKGFIKQQLSDKQLNMIKRKYKKYPKFIEASIYRPTMYNETLDYINELEKDKKIFVFRPSETININPIKRTINDVNKVYDLGCNDAKKQIDKLIRYLK